MRRWFEIHDEIDPLWADQYMQLPQKSEFCAWVKQLVGVNARLTTGTGDPTACVGVGATHPITAAPGVNVVTASGDLASLMLLQGLTPTFQGLIRQYFDKPGIYDGPNESQTVEKPRGGTKTGGSGGGTLTISLLSYLLLLLNTWQGGGRLKSGQFVVTPAPQRWQEWLTTLINHYGRYTPTQIYAFLAMVDFTGPTFKV